MTVYVLLYHDVWDLECDGNPPEDVTVSGVYATLEDAEQAQISGLVEGDYYTIEEHTLGVYTDRGERYAFPTS